MCVFWDLYLSHSNHTCYRPQGKKDDQINILNMEVEALKTRCGVYEKRIDDLKSRCDTYENTLEMLRQQVVCLHDSQGTLSTEYHEKEYILAA